MQPDRPPIKAYEHGVFRLVQATFEGATEDQLRYAREMLADMHWVSDAKVTRDVQIEVARFSLSAIGSRVYPKQAGGF